MRKKETKLEEMLRLHQAPTVYVKPVWNSREVIHNHIHSRPDDPRERLAEVKARSISDLTESSEWADDGMTKRERKKLTDDLKAGGLP